MANQYLTVAELALAVDTTLLASLGADGGSTGTVNQSNAILVTAIARASGMIDAAVTVANQYTPERLLVLYDDGDWTIRSLCAGLALWMLYSRRGKDTPSNIQEQIDLAMRMLDDLRDGKKVFADDAARNAGLPSIAVIPASTRVKLRLEGNSPFYPIVQTEVQ